jgi:hypothetical protein
MGLRDKVRAPATRHADALLRDLGAAYFAQQAHGGSAEAISTALANVVAHEAEHGAVTTASDPFSAALSSGVSYNIALL